MKKQIIAVITPENKSTRYDDNASYSLEKLKAVIKPDFKFRREVIRKFKKNVQDSWE